MKFHTFATSVSGASHIETKRPCQDSSGVLEFTNIQAIAVADGHGGSNYFRSEIGSRLAVDVAFNQVKNFCNKVAPFERFSESGIKNFKHSFKQAWIDAVKDDWQKNPVDENEPRWAEVSDEYKKLFTSNKDFVPVAYGTTLLLAVSIGSQVLIMQIGDGTCAVLLSNGEFKIPVPPDEENFLNVTTSLCDINAEQKFRHVILNCDEFIFPAAIFLSTDGLDDCYPPYENENFLYSLYSDVIISSMIEREGFEDTEQELREDFLSEMSVRASGDDISLAYMTVENTDFFKEILAQNQSERN